MRFEEEIIAFREDIHAHPELGNAEFRTAGIVERELTKLGIETRRLTDTAVMGILRGGLPGKTIAFRADMDALPLTEATNAHCQSLTEGVMHACGHDVHTAALIGAAKLLAAEKDTLPGSVVFLFQPDEEGSGGAERMVASGALDTVDAVFGAHVDPDLPVGTIGVRYGKFYAASDMYTIKIHGKSAHGAQPEKGIDALGAAALLVCRLKEIPSHFAPEPCVVTIGMLKAGTAGNILAGEAEMRGILRTLGPDTRQLVRTMIRDAITSVEEETGVRTELSVEESYPGIVNDDAMTAIAEEAAARCPFIRDVQRIDKPKMTTEDFGCFASKVPGSFYHIGVGGDYPLHNPHFFPENEALIIASQMHCALIRHYLSK